MTDRDDHNLDEFYHTLDAEIKSPELRWGRLLHELGERDSLLAAMREHGIDTTYVARGSNLFYAPLPSLDAITSFESAQLSGRVLTPYALRTTPHLLSCVVMLSEVYDCLSESRPELLPKDAYYDRLVASYVNWTDQESNKQA